VSTPTLIISYNKLTGWWGHQPRIKKTLQQLSKVGVPTDLNHFSEQGNWLVWTPTKDKNKKPPKQLGGFFIGLYSPPTKKLENVLLSHFWSR
jgi:hypothetical protein